MDYTVKLELVLLEFFMTNLNPENGKDPQKDPASSQGQPAPAGGAGEVIPSGDLEKALDYTKTQLRELERKLGEEKSMNTVKDPPSGARTAVSPGKTTAEANAGDVDQTLASLERDLAQLTQEVSQDTAGITATTENPASPSTAQGSIDDLLADLSEELNSVTNPVEEKSASTNDIAAGASAPAGGSTESGTALPPPVQDIIEKFPGEVESAPDSGASSDAQPAKSAEKDVRSIIDHLPDVEGAVEPEGAAASALQSEPAKPEPSQAAEDPFAAFAKAKDGKSKSKPAVPSKIEAISEDEQVVLKELDQAEKNFHNGMPSAPAAPAALVPPPAPASMPIANAYAGFSVPEKVLIYGMQVANKPFSFVGASTRDKIGIAAVVTLIVTMLAGGILLYFH